MKEIVCDGEPLDGLEVERHCRAHGDGVLSKSQLFLQAICDLNDCCQKQDTVEI